MANINNINSGIDYSVFFGGSSSNSSAGVDLTSYMSIKNGSYRKLLKNYYDSQKQEAKASIGDSGENLTRIKASADTLKKKADVFSSDKLWATEEITDETSGIKKEVFSNTESIVKAVKEFADSYNQAIDAAYNSKTKSVLRSGEWLDTMTEKHGRLLNEVGITVGADGKLSVNEEELKKANITTMKSLFQGIDSYAVKVSAKAAGLSNAAATKEATYSADGTWIKSISTVAESRINTVIGDNGSSAGRTRTDTENSLKSLKEKREKLKKEMDNALGYDARRTYESQISKLDKEISDTEKKIKYL